MVTKLNCILLSRNGYQKAKDLQKGAPFLVEIFAPEGLSLEGTTAYKDCAALVTELYSRKLPILGFCACGILIRILAPILAKRQEDSPVLAITQEGTYCIPLLGVAQGANGLAQQIAQLLKGKPIITTSGEGKFAINLHNPPSDLVLLNEAEVKPFLTKLLNGEKIRPLNKKHSWFSQSKLPFCQTGKLNIILCDKAPDYFSRDSLYYLRKAKRGNLCVIGIGPGNKLYLTQSARQQLNDADEIFGYHYYLDLAGPFSVHQKLYPSDNGKELSRAKMALAHAYQGQNVVLLSSGDPGVFAMASALFEVVDKEICNHTEQINNINIHIEPGITACLAGAALLGAPLGHDFVVISLSDNLKDWKIIENRLIHALEGDFVIAIYNPVSNKRANNLIKLLALLQQHCCPSRLVGVASDIARTDQSIGIFSLGTLPLDVINSRSILIIGSTRTKKLQINDKAWLWTPRYYKA